MLLWLSSVMKVTDFDNFDNNDELVKVSWNDYYHDKTVVHYCLHLMKCNLQWSTSRVWIALTKKQPLDAFRDAARGWLVILNCPHRNVTPNAVKHYCWQQTLHSETLLEVDWWFWTIHTTFSLWLPSNCTSHLHCTLNQVLCIKSYSKLMFIILKQIDTIICLK